MDFLGRIFPRTAYPDFVKMVVQARTLLKKTPPPNAVVKWSELESETYRNNLSDNDAVVAMLIVVALMKKQTTIPLFFCDSWEVLSKNMEISTSLLEVS